MGYACPVCGDPQADAEHLANHLAFTALMRGGDHEAWLDDHVGEWGQLGESELADRVVDHADETEFPQVFEEGGTHDHGDEPPPGAERGAERSSMSDADAAVLEEARKLTKEMLAEADAAGDEPASTDATDNETE